ncbi:MAG: glycosyltransferase [Acidobacteria bacterium]|nr:glycosyltransferase [Acidobacteriota bacterium]
MKSVLVIAHDFPPFGGGGVLRVLKFTKYLPEFGWNPIVLSVDPTYYPVGLLDYSLMSEIPEQVKIYRTKTAISAYKIKETNKKENKKFNWRNILENFIPDSFRVIQDHGFFWLPYALAKAQSIIQKENIQLIFTTSPPHNVHILGSILKKRYGLPWVADFRDGWTRNEMYTAKSQLRQQIDKVFERFIVNLADQIICVTPELAEDFYQDYPKVKKKTSVIYNGFDPADFEKLNKVEKDKNTFTLSHIGSLAAKPNRSPEIILQAVSSIASTNKEFKENFRLEFVGPVLNLPLEEMITKYSLESICSVIGVVPHLRALEHMQKADALLLLTNHKQKFGDNAILAGKFGEYLFTANPILAVVSEGIAKDIIENYDLGYVVSPDDLEKTKEFLYELFYKWKNKSLPNNKDKGLTSLFNRKCSTEKLANIFNNLS